MTPVRERPAGYTLRHEVFGPLSLLGTLHDIRPVHDDRQRWLVVNANRQVVRLDVEAGTSEVLATLPDDAVPLGEDERYALHLSADDRFAAVVNRVGQFGVVLDLTTGAVTMRLNRDDYHNEYCQFSIAFVSIDDRMLLVHASDWNRLDVSDPATGELLTPRELPTRAAGQPRPEHHLDYFHSGLTTSPDGRWVADNGWVWHPVGIPCVWDVRRWVSENVWESEDGPSRRDLCGRVWVWDKPFCWVGDDHLAVWGLGDDTEKMQHGVRVFDATSGKETHSFPGPQGELAFDGELLSFDGEGGFAVWDITTGERLHHDAEFQPLRYHPGAKTFLTQMPAGRFRVSRVVRPAGPEQSGETVRALARTIRAGRRWDLLPILADALEEAGCTDAEVLTHCRTPGDHGHRCWVVERILDTPGPPRA